MQKVIGVFSSRGQAEQAAEQLRQEGFDKEISILAKGTEQESGEMGENNNNIANGTTSGATIGALGGLALGAGALAIPGVGPLLAAGPIVSAISGAAVGGLGGALVDYGIPEEESRQYESDIKQGKTLIGVECSENKVSKAKQVLQEKGADNIKEH